MNEEFRSKIIALRGNLGKEWLQNLPDIIKDYEQRWGITCLPPFPLSYNYVAPATTQDGRNVVLKISFPENQAFPFEVEALDFYSGDGAIEVLKEDIKNGVILLEKAEPGTRLRDISDEEQIRIASDVMKRLHKPVSESTASHFPTISDWAKAFDRYRDKFSKSPGPVPQWMFDKAEEIFEEFPKAKNEHVLLHGDLHSDNILSSSRGWLAIDPKGVIGEREFELGTYLRNPLYDYPKGSDYEELEKARILQFAEGLGFDKDRILSWAFANAVISLLWFIEDENYFKEIYVLNAELLNGIRF